MSAAQLAVVLGRLDHEVHKIEDAAVDALEEFGHVVAAAASAKAPVETGALRDSFLGGPDGLAENGVRTGVDRRGHPFVEVGSRLPYASTIEYEDVAMLRPAINETEAVLPQKIKAHVRTAVRLEP